MGGNIGENIKRIVGKELEKKIIGIWIGFLQRLLRKNVLIQK